MNKYILLSLFVAAAAFGAAHDESPLNKVIEAARRNDAQAVLAQGAQLAEKDKRTLACDLDFLHFIVTKIETNEIAQHNKSEFLDLCPAVGNKLAFQALKTGNTTAIREHLVAEQIRLAAEANEKKQAETARIEQERKAAEFEEAVQTFNNVISTYHQNNCDARDALVHEITRCAHDVHELNNQALIALTGENPFMELIHDLAIENNAHALKQIKDIFALHALPMNNICSQTITALVHAHEDAPHDMQPAPSNQVPAEPQHEESEELNAAIALSLSEHQNNGAAQIEQPILNTLGDNAALIIETPYTAPAPTFWQQYRTPIIATGLITAACGIGAYVWNRYCKQ